MKILNIKKIAGCGLACGKCGKCPEDIGLIHCEDGQIRTVCCEGDVWFHGRPLNKDEILDKVAQIGIDIKPKMSQVANEAVLAKNLDKLLVVAKKRVEEPKVTVILTAKQKAILKLEAAFRNAK